MFNEEFSNVEKIKGKNSKNKIIKKIAFAYNS